jgi:TolA-binding protein
MRLELYFASAAIIGIMLFRVHSYFNEKYSGTRYYETKLVILQEEIDRHDLEKAIAEKEKFDYQQSLAMQVPDLIKKNPYMGRNIASVVSDHQETLKFDTTAEQLTAAKEAFNNGQFKVVVEKLEPIYKKQPEHPLAPEATFLLMEAQHFLGKREEANIIIENMLRLYPESFLTGYALLRLAEYFLQEGDEDRAKYLYEFVREKFSYDPQIVKIASESLQRLRDDTSY